MPKIIKNGIEYGSASHAENVSYDNSSSGISATDVQSAIDEVNTSINNIGSITSGTSNGVSVASSTVTEVASIVLAKGTYIVVFCGDWAGKSGGYRQISNVTDINPARQLANTLFPTTTKEAYHQLVIIKTYSAQTTEKMYALQDSGSAITIYPYIYAIRLA